MAAYLEDRVESLERLITGSKCVSSWSGASAAATGLPGRVQALSARVTHLYAGVPEMRENIDLCLELEKKLYRKRTSILQVGEKVQYLTSLREELLASFQMLDSVKTLTPHADGNGLTFQDDPTLRTKVAALDATLGGLQALCTRQSDEVNALLDANEEMVHLLSSKSADWDAKLSLLERGRGQGGMAS